MSITHKNNKTPTITNKTTQNNQPKRNRQEYSAQRYQLKNKNITTDIYNENKRNSN